MKQLMLTISSQSPRSFYFFVTTEMSHSFFYAGKKISWMLLCVSVWPCLLFLGSTPPLWHKVSWNERLLFKECYSSLVWSQIPQTIFISTLDSDCTALSLYQEGHLWREVWRRVVFPWPHLALAPVDEVWHRSSWSHVASAGCWRRRTWMKRTSGHCCKCGSLSQAPPSTLGTGGMAFLTSSHWKWAFVWKV